MRFVRSGNECKPIGVATAHTQSLGGPSATASTTVRGGPTRSSQLRARTLGVSSIRIRFISSCKTAGANWA